QYTHNGLNYHIATFANDRTKEQALHHDQIANTDLLDVAGGLSFAVNPSWGFFVTEALCDEDLTTLKQVDSSAASLQIDHTFSIYRRTHRPLDRCAPEPLLYQHAAHWQV